MRLISASGQKFASIILTVVIGLVLILANGIPGLSQDKITLVFRQNDTPTTVKGLAEAVEEFSIIHPNIKARFETVPWKDALQQFIRETAVGAGPDVLMSAFVWTRDLAESGRVLNLDSLMKKDPLPRGIEDFIAVDLGVYKDSVYGIPWTTDTITMVYRKDLFKEAGIGSFPDDSWSHFQTVAKKLSRPEEGKYGFVFSAGSSFQCGSDFLSDYYLWSNGSTYIEQAPDGTWRPGVDVETLTDTIQYFKRFFDERISPDSTLASDELNDPLITSGIARGDFAITFSGPQGMDAVLNANPEAPVWSAQIPAGKVTRISHLGGRTLVINEHAKYPDLAWKLLKWMCSDYVMSEHYRQIFSAQKSQLKIIDYPVYFEGYVKMIPQAQTYYTYVMSPMRVATKRELVNREFNAAYAGVKTAEEASRAIIEKIKEELKE